MKVLNKRTLADGSTGALLQFAPNQSYKMGLRLVRLRAGIDASSVKRLDQRGAGIELINQWTAPWNPNPGPRAGWTKILQNGEIELQQLLPRSAN